MGDKRKYQNLRDQAFLAKRKGDFREAESLLIAAVREVSEDPHDRPDLSRTLNTLAYLYVVSGELSRSIEIANSDVEVCRQLPTESRILLGNALMFLAGVLIEAGEYSGAVSAAEEGIPIYANVMGENHSETQRMRMILNEAQQKLGQSNAHVLHK